MDILEKQLNNGGEIKESDLQAIFSEYFEDIPQDLPDNFIETTVHTKNEYGDYDIKVSDMILLEMKRYQVKNCRRIYRSRRYGSR